jgi:tRNA (guanine37-N1)-methyltransferase
VNISILTIFPDYFGAPFAEGMIRLALEKRQLVTTIVPLRDFTSDSHRTTDDYPFGGGVGMIMKVDPIDRALDSIAAGERHQRRAGTRVVLFSPQGRRFTQGLAIEYAQLEHLVLVCGRYKGVDERVAENLIDR